MKNWLLVFFVAGVLTASGWYISRDKSSQILSGQEPGSQAVVLPILADSADDAKTAAPDNSTKNDLLKAQALEIVSRPVSVKIQISDSSRKNTLAKLDELIKLIKDNYDYVNAWYDLGAYRMVIGDYDGAVDAYKFVALIKPGDYVGYANLGDIYANYLKNYSLAEENFLKAVKNNPAYVSGYADLAGLYEKYFDDGLQKAENLFLSGIRLNADNLYLKIKLAEFYDRNDKKSAALALFREVLALDPSNKSVQEEI